MISILVAALDPAKRSLMIAAARQIEYRFDLAMQLVALLMGS